MSNKGTEISNELLEILKEYKGIEGTYKARLSLCPF